MKRRLFNLAAAVSLVLVLASMRGVSVPHTMLSSAFLPFSFMMSDRGVLELGNVYLASGCPPRLEYAGLEWWYVPVASGGAWMLRVSWSYPTMLFAVFPVVWWLAWSWRLWSVRRR